MVWICTENSVDNTDCFSYCWAVLAQSRYFFLITLPEQAEGWRCTGNWVETQLWQLSPADQSICLHKSPLWMTKPCCPGDDSLPPCWMWSIALIPGLFGLCVWLLLYLLNCLYLKSPFFRWKWVSSLVMLSYPTPHQNINSCSSALCKSIGSKLCSCCSK